MQRAGEQYYLKSHSNIVILPGQVFKHAIRQNGYLSFQLIVYQDVSRLCIIYCSRAKKQP